MLDRIFLQVAARSAAGGLVILLLLIVRPLMKKVPRACCYALWGIVLLRLLCPVLPTSPLALLPQTDTAVEQTLSAVADAAAPSEISVSGQTDSPVPTAPAPAARPQARNSAIQAAALLRTAGAVWLTGVLLLLCISLRQDLRLKRQLRGAVRLQDGLYCSAAVATPFTFGILRPKIYLPADFDGARQQYVLLHERQHLRRFDYLTQPLGWLAVCLHWFNPLVWIAFRLAKRDMEISCDEAVIRLLGTDCRADYADTLLRLSVCRHPTGAAIGFGKGDSAERIRHLSRWKKPKRWICIAAAVLCVGLAVCLLTTRPDANAGQTQSDAPEEAQLTLSAPDDSAPAKDVPAEKSEPAPEETSEEMPEDIPEETPESTPEKAPESGAAELPADKTGAAVHLTFPASAEGWLWPVPEYTHVARDFEGSDKHNGIDIAAPLDTPICAARDGTVLEAEYSGVGYGVYAIIDHGDGFSTMYSHCSSLAVEAGDTVKVGDQSGYFVSTGNSTGNHLHFEVRDNGTQTDPVPYVGQG